MRFFNLEPGGGHDDEGRAPVGDLLQSISPALEDLGAKRAVLIVEDASGVSIAISHRQGEDDGPKATADLLLRVALDAKELAGA